MKILKIDEFLFEKYYQIWKTYVEKESGEVFKSFGSNTFTSEEEGYKENFIFPTARVRLSKKDWKHEDIGTGKILKHVLSAIEFKENNLLPWYGRYGEDSKPHIALCKALGTEKRQKNIEQIFFDLYKNTVEDSISFELLLKEVGKQYSLMSYLFFLKDKQKYAPVATKYFDQAFSKLGIDFKTSRKCSWENYSVFNNILNEIKYLLSDKLEVDVSLIESHTFVWMVSAYPIEDDIQRDKKTISDYKELPTEKDKEAIVKSRRGQGIFRKRLLEYWNSSCAITDCDASNILIASHIKPWSDCSIGEALDYYNGLLLTPNYDKLLDNGYISFDDNGNIILSEKLSRENIQRLGIDKNAKLKQIEEQHKVYLRYHRQLFRF